MVTIEAIWDAAKDLLRRQRETAIGTVAIEVDERGQFHRPEALCRDLPRSIDFFLKKGLKMKLVEIFVRCSC